MNMKIVWSVACLMFLMSGQLWAKTVTVGPADSSVLFRINHDQGYTIGYFKDFTCVVELGDDQGQLLGAKAQVETRSVNTHNSARDEGLRSDLFFDADQFPQATFESTRVEGDQLTGILTIKGIARPMTLKIQQDAGKILLQGSFNRNDYKIDFNKLLVNKKKAIGEMVDLIVELKVK